MARSTFTIDGVMAALAASAKPMTARAIINAMGAQAHAREIRELLRLALESSQLIAGHGRDGEQLYAVPLARAVAPRTRDTDDVGTASSPYRVVAADRSPEPEDAEDVRRRDVVAATLPTAVTAEATRAYESITEGELVAIVDVIVRAGGTAGGRIIALAFPKMTQSRRYAALKKLRLRGDIEFIGTGTNVVYRAAGRFAVDADVDDPCVTAAAADDAAAPSDASDDDATPPAAPAPAIHDDADGRSSVARAMESLSIASSRDATLESLERALTSSNEALAHYLSRVDPEGLVETMLITRDQARLALTRYLDRRGAGVRA